MGSRGQSRKRQLAQLDRASEKYNNLQERSDSISPIGGRFYDNNTGREIPREEVEKLAKDLTASRERFEDLRDKMIERESRAAQRAAARAAKRQATRDRQAGNMPAGVRVTFLDGTQRYYTQGPDGMVADQYGYPVSLARGMKYNQLIKQIKSNQSASGVKIEKVSSKELKAIRDAYREEQRNKPDYEMGIGTPWGNKDNRRAARQSRLAGRIAKYNR